MALTKKDLESIRKIVNEEVDKSLDMKLEVTLDIKLSQRLQPINNHITNLYQLVYGLEQKVTKLSERIDFLPTKEDFYNKMDELIGEIKDYRQERCFLSGRLDRLETRMDLLENKML